jgi:hypothetical protein
MNLSGGIGDDVIDGSADPDEISGLAGDDHLYGHANDDHLFGGEGNDLLAGGEGNDLLEGDTGDDTVDGGAGDDSLTGGAGTDTVVFRDGYGHDVVMDFDPTTDLVRVSSGGIESWADLQTHLSADHDGTAILTLLDGSTLRFEGLTLQDLSQQNFTIDPPPVCFAAGTLIETACGAVFVDTLKVGDGILTLDHGPQPVLWVGRRLSQFGHGPHRHQPIVIAKDAMGPGLPFADLSVSPQHRLLVTGHAPARGVLAKAKGLCGRPGITQDHARTATEYFQLLLPQHAILFANGLAAESFYPGPFALTGLPVQDRALILGLLAGNPLSYGPTARPVLPLRAIRKLDAAGILCPVPCPIRVRAA